MPDPGGLDEFVCRLTQGQSARRSLQVQGMLDCNPASLPSSVGLNGNGIVRRSRENAEENLQYEGVFGSWLWRHTAPHILRRRCGGRIGRRTVGRRTLVTVRPPHLSHGAAT